MIAILLVAALVIVVWIAMPDRPGNGLVWLTESQFTESIKPGVGTRIKYKLVALTPAMFRHFWNTSRSVLVDGTIMQFTGPPAGDAGLGPPVAASPDGTRAWMIPSENLKDLRPRIEKGSTSSSINGTRVQTGDKMLAVLAVGTSIPLPTNQLFAGINVKVLPKISRHAIRLDLAVIATELDPGTITTTTNVDLACNAVVSNHLSLVISCPTNSAGTRYWLFLTPSVVDAKGKPINY